MKNLKLKNIANGWKNAALNALGATDEHLQIQIKRRREVCENCSLNHNGMCSHAREGKAKYAPEIETRGCGCPIFAKTASAPESCPLYKWTQMLNEKDFWMLEKFVENQPSFRTIVYEEGRERDIICYRNTEQKAYFTAEGKYCFPYLNILSMLKDHRLKRAAVVYAQFATNYIQKSTAVSPTTAMKKILNVIRPNEDVFVVFEEDYFDTMSGKRTSDGKINKALRFFVDSMEDLKQQLNVIHNNDVRFMLLNKGVNEQDLYDTLIENHYLLDDIKIYD